MRVKLKTLMCGPGGSFSPGQVLDLPSVEAAVLVEGGFAVALDELPTVKEPADAPVENESLSAEKPAEDPPEEEDKPVSKKGKKA